MIVKVFKGIWFVSLLGSIAVLMYVYASLPDPVAIGAGDSMLQVSRGTVFYVTLGALAIFNLIVFVISALFPVKEWFFRMWVYGLVGLLNLFFTVTMEFLSLLNSQEKFDYGSIGFIIYGVIFLVIIWAAVCPVYYLSRRISNKQTI